MKTFLCPDSPCTSSVWAGSFVRPPSLVRLSASPAHGVHGLPGWRLALVLLLVLLPILARAQTYHLLKDIPIGGVGGWDYLSSDDEANRLYVTHGDRIVVINTETDLPVGEIADTPGVHGFAIAHDLDRGFSSNGKEDKVSIVDLTTLKTLSKVDTGKGPDAILYASGTKEVYAFNGKDQSATVFDATSGKAVATIALPGTPEFAVYDAGTNLIFDNIEDKSEVVVIDGKTHQIVNTWPLGPGTSPSGIAMDHEHQRLFVGCRNRLMVMLDATSGKVLASVPIGEHVDATAFNPHGHLALSSNGDGTLTAAYEEPSDKLVVVQEVMTEKGARTMALNLATQRIYVATADFDPPPADAPPVTRPTPIPGTFKVLVYEK